MNPISYRTVDSLLATLLPQPLNPVPGNVPAQQHDVSLDAGHGPGAATRSRLPDVPPDYLPPVSDIYMVGRPGRECPMAFVSKVDKDSGSTIVTLRRLDWKSLSRFRRFCARVRSFFFNSEPPHKRRLSQREAIALQLAGAEFAPENRLLCKLGRILDTPTNEDASSMPECNEPVPSFSASALSSWNTATDVAPSHRNVEDAANADDGGSAPPRKLIARRLSPEQAAALRKTEAQSAMKEIVLAYLPIVRAQRDRVGQLGQPPHVKLQLERRMLAQTLGKVEAQCDRFRLAADEKAAVLAALRLDTTVLVPPQSLGIAPQSAAAPLLDGRLLHMSYRPAGCPVNDPNPGSPLAGLLKGWHIPVRDPVLAGKREIVLGEMHGDWKLFLHSLVQAGFLCRKDGDGEAWDRMWKAIGEMDDSNGEAWKTHWETVLAQLPEAIKAQDGSGSQRRLTLSGNLVGPRESAGPMLAILRRVIEAGLSFDCLLGPDELELATLANQRPDAFAPGQGDRGDSQELAEAARRWLVPRLKLVSCSSDGTAMYAFRFADRTALAPIAEAAGLKAFGEVHADVKRINGWLERVLRAGPDEAVASDRDMLRTFIKGEGAQRSGLWTPASEPPHPAVRYVVHAHQPDVEPAVAATLARVEALQADMDALRVLFPRTKTGRYWTDAALVPLTAMLKRLDAGSPPHEIDAAANVLAVAICNEPALLNHKEAYIVGAPLRQADGSPEQKLEALSSLARMWNEVYSRNGDEGDDDNRDGFDIARLEPGQQTAFFDAIRSRLESIRDKQSFRNHLHELHATTSARTDALRSAIRAVNAGHRPDKRDIGKPAATGAAEPASQVPGSPLVDSAPKRYVPPLSSTELNAYLTPLRERFHSVHHAGQKDSSGPTRLAIHAID